LPASDNNRTFRQQALYRAYAPEHVQFLSQTKSAVPAAPVAADTTADDDEVPFWKALLYRARFPGHQAVSREGHRNHDGRGVST
jgi:hypothetical protein